MAPALLLAALVIAMIFVCCVIDQCRCFRPRGYCYSLGMKSKRIYVSCCVRLERCQHWCNQNCRRTKTTKDSLVDLENIAHHLIVLHSMDAMEEGNDVLNRDLESSVKLLIQNNREHFKPPSKMINPFFADYDRCKAKIIDIILEKHQRNLDDRISDNSDDEEEGKLQNEVILV